MAHIMWRLCTPLALLAASCGLVFGKAAHAQSYPTKAVSVVVPFPPGGGVDILMRAIAGDLSKVWGQAVVIDNKPGAGSLIGAAAVARSPADGYTLLATINQTMTTNRFLYKQLPYKPESSFVAVTALASSDQILVASQSLPVSDLKGLIELARSRPGTLAYGSFGSGSHPHLLYETMKAKAQIDLTHVPYPGVAPVMSALMGGQIQASAASANVAGEILRAGKLKPLAIAGQRRSKQFPSVATTAEQGYPDLQASIWYGLFAPAGTPEPIIKKISADINRILSDRRFVQANFTARGLDSVTGGADALQRLIADEVAVTGRLIRTAGVQPE